MELEIQELTVVITEKVSYLVNMVLGYGAIPVPLWMAVLVGLLLGWVLGLRRKQGTAVQALPALPCQPQAPIEQEFQERALALPSRELSEAGLNGPAIQLDDLKDFYLKLHQKDGGPPWEFMLERSIPGMLYQAWRRDPQGGPTEYRTRHVFEDATPQIVKDFLCDDEFRHEWDDLVLSINCFEGRNETGECVTHWVKKFPFFCSNREYVTCKRTFECGGSFFCITKAVSHAAFPVRKKPRRVVLYSSSICIKAVESSQTGEMTACEVTFVHGEDMLIQRDLAKIGVRRGIWPLVKKMEPGLRKYQAYRKASSTLSFSASIAQLVTVVPVSEFISSSSSSSSSSSLSSNSSRRIVEPVQEIVAKQGHASGGGWKWVALRGVVILACGFGGGALARVVVYGAAKRLSRLGRKP